MSSVHDSHIERGMALLDEKVPGWEHRLDLRTLDLGSHMRCVVGQVFEIKSPGLLSEGYRALGLGRVWPRSYGFALDWDLGYRATYGGLTRAWKRKIRERRGG